MNRRGKLFDFGFWKKTPSAAESELLIINARRRIFAKIHKLETDATAKASSGRYVRQLAGRSTGLMRRLWLWRAHSLEESGRRDLREVVAMRKAARRAGLESPGHRSARREAFRNAEGGDS